MKNIKCRNCFFYRNEWCEKIVDSPDPEEVRDCAYFREMTNADKIRSMTDEELANIVECPYGNPYFDEHLPCKGSCHDCLLIWLQRPVEEEDHA